MSYPMDLKRDALRALGAINESPELATWRDWCAVGLSALAFFGTIALAFLFAWSSLHIAPQL